MDVRCERCSTEYDFEEARIPVEGLAVKCSACSHVFRVYRNLAPHGGEEQPWMVRQASGNIVRFKEMTTLQRWIVERKVTRDDAISRTGKSWKRLGDINELAPFFQAVDRPAPTPTPLVEQHAQRAGWEGRPQALPQVEQSGAWQIGAPVDTDDEPDWKPKRRTGLWVTLILLVVLVGGSGGVWLLRPDLVRSWLGTGVDPRAEAALARGYRTLLADSYAAMDEARRAFEEAQTLAPAWGEPKAALAQVELNRAEYVAEEAQLMANKAPTMAAPEQEILKKEIEKRQQEFTERTQKAFELGKQALGVAPESAAASRVMADYYRIMKSPEPAKPLLERARALAPTDPLVAYVSGASQSGDAAVRFFEEALGAEPAMNRARYKLARLHQAQANTEKALAETRQVLLGTPDHERAQQLLMELEPPKAAGVAAPANPPAPDAPVGEPKKELSFEQLVAQADRLRQTDQSQKALKLYERAIEMEPADAEALTGLGWCHLDLEAPDAAIAAFKSALKALPRFTDAHLGLAEAYKMKGMKRDAVKHYQLYLDILPEGPEANVAERMIQQLGGN